MLGIDAACGREFEESDERRSFAALGFFRTLSRLCRRLRRASTQLRGAESGRWAHHLSDSNTRSHGTAPGRTSLGPLAAISTMVDGSPPVTWPASRSKSMWAASASEISSARDAACSPDLFALVAVMQNPNAAATAHATG